MTAAWSLQADNDACVEVDGHGNQGRQLRRRFGDMTVRAGPGQGVPRRDSRPACRYTKPSAESGYRRDRRLVCDFHPWVTISWGSKSASPGLNAASIKPSG